MIPQPSSPPRWRPDPRQSGTPFARGIPPADDAIVVVLRQERGMSEERFATPADQELAVMRERLARTFDEVEASRARFRTEMRSEFKSLRDVLTQHVTLSDATDRRFVLRLDDHERRITSLERK
jgi:hypothetical protein